MRMNMEDKVPIWEKSCLTISEAAQYFGIGEKKLREMVKRPDCKFVLWSGTKCLIKRKVMDKYLENEFSI